MLQKIEEVRSDLEKKKMQNFSNQMNKYGRLLSPNSKVGEIDSLFYRVYRLEKMRGQSV
jgi:hypothetical protein